MRCPKCAKESTKKERTGGVCPACGWTFRFDPPAPLSDFEVEHAIQTVSRKGAHRYTRAQLVAEVERVLVKRATRIYETEAESVLATQSSPFVWVFALGLVIVGLILLAVFQELCGTPLLILAVMILISRLFRRDPKVVAAEIRAKVEPFDRRAAGIVDRYLGSDAPPLLVEAPDTGISRETSRHAPRREFDLESYGFDRVIVVQGDDNVDMLVKNQFHFQHNAAIISFTGYPSHVASLVRRQLEAGETAANLFLLHDGDGDGGRLVQSFREHAWTKGANLHDVGLSPAHTTRLLPRRPLGGWPLGTEPVLNEGYSKDYRVPLSVLRPEQMMTLLFNAISAVERGQPVTVLHTGDPGDAIETVADVAYDFG